MPPFSFGEKGSGIGLEKSNLSIGKFEGKYL